MSDNHTVARLTPLELMRLHLDALYTYDERGRMLAVNQWDGGVPPRLHLGRTVDGNTWRIRSDLPVDLATALDALCLEEPPLADPAQPPRCRDAILGLLADHAPVERIWSGPAYVVPVDSPPNDRVTAVTQSNAALLRNGLHEWLPDVPHRQPFMAVVVDGRAVALCASVRITPAVHEAGVETLPAFRRRGHAATVVAGWAAAVAALGAVPLYSTAWENRASQAVAARVGAIRYGVDHPIL